MGDVLRVSLIPHLVKGVGIDHFLIFVHQHTEGVAITSLRPAGVGLFADERVDVVSESEWIEEGTPIRIMSAEGYRHVVRAVRPRQISDRP